MKKPIDAQAVKVMRKASYNLRKLKQGKRTRWQLL
jgi:hypothetical protein